MVAGYIIDGLATLHARARGGAGAKSRNPEISHNFVLCHRLSSRVKWAFWYSNVPYWVSFQGVRFGMEGVRFGMEGVRLRMEGVRFRVSSEGFSVKDPTSKAMTRAPTP